MDLRALPKAELHCHLNGAVPAATLADLLLRYHLAPPDLRDHGRLTDKLTFQTPKANLGEYLAIWSLLRLLPVGRPCFHAMVDAAIRAQAEAGVTYVEMRHSIIRLAELNGLSYTRALGWVCEELQEAGRRWGVTTRLIVPFLRDRFDAWNYEGLLSAIQDLKDPTVVGLDSAGDEVHPAPTRAAEFFRRGQEFLGLNLTVHAGETGEVSHIRWALDECGADRIGHGIAAAQDPDLMAELKDRDVPIEVCLTSNWLTGGVPSLEVHPVTTFIEHQVPFVLCTDNPGLHGVNLVGEYDTFRRVTGREDLLAGMRDRAMRYAFTAPAGDQ
ncbi:MAG TPA: adenosine deaminase [bacterium]|nr:adenosine deaminase [bacterium]